MEGSVDWHHRLPKGYEVEDAFNQLREMKTHTDAPVSMEMIYGS